MNSAPSGYDDFASDAEDAPPLGPVRDLHVEGVGVVRARKPLPRSGAALVAAVRPQMPAHFDQARRQDVTAKLSAQGVERFLRLHLDDGEYERIADAMMDDALPDDTIGRVLEAIAAWGTGRPTRPSPRCA